MEMSAEWLFRPTAPCRPTPSLTPAYAPGCASVDEHADDLRQDHDA
jgi:hypothetical protein